jgi:hypothetical protein
MLCHGSVRVEKDAQTGPAVMRVEFPEASRFKSFATDIAIEIR